MKRIGNPKSNFFWKWLHPHNLACFQNMKCWDCFTYCIMLILHSFLSMCHLMTDCFLWTLFIQTLVVGGFITFLCYSTGRLYVSSSCDNIIPTVEVPSVLVPILSWIFCFSPDSYSRSLWRRLFVVRQSRCVGRCSSRLLHAKCFLRLLASGNRHELHQSSTISQVTS